MYTFDSYVPEKSKKLLQYWIDEINVSVGISNPRKSKLGDFRVVDNQMKITINNNLNKYSFLITLVHELAHAFMFKKYKYNVSPHGKHWRLMFKSLMLNFLSPDYFPEDILRVLSKHMINPKASTFTDLNLIKILKKYDINSSVTISNLSAGDLFKIDSGKIFLRGEISRKRIKCIECKTKNIYLFHPFTEITIMK